MGGLGGGLEGLLPLLAFGGGLGSTSTSGSGSSSSDEGGVAADCASANIAAFLSANVGRRLKLTLGLQSLFPIFPQEITARIVCAGSDFVVIDRICHNGQPLLDPRRLTLLTTTILGAQRLTPTDELIDLFCVFD